MNIKIDNTEYSFKNKKTANWKIYQLQFMNADDISIDHKIKKFAVDHQSWTFNIQFASTDLRCFFQDNNIKTDAETFDFFIISDLEFGKKSVSLIEDTIKDWYKKSTNGGYFSFQSYYLNWNNNTLDLKLDLDDDMDIAVVQWVERYLGVSTYTNDSLKISNPLSNVLETGELVAGSDFMYTHGNTRFWLWKK